MQIFSFIFLHTHKRRSRKDRRTIYSFVSFNEYVKWNETLSTLKWLFSWEKKKKMNWIREYVNRLEIQNTHQHPKAKALMNTKYSTTITKWNCAISHFERNTRELKGEEKKKHTTTNIVYILAMWENRQERETSDKTKKKKHRKKEAIHRNSQHSDKIILNLKTSTTFAME